MLTVLVALVARAESKADSKSADQLSLGNVDWLAGLMTSHAAVLGDESFGVAIEKLQTTAILRERLLECVNRAFGRS